MLIRRLALFAQFPLAVVLPVWVFVARGIIAERIGVQSIVYLFACPALFIGLGGVAGLTNLRKLVRLERALSWTDVGVLGALWGALLLYGFFAEIGIAVAIVVLLILAFWFAVWELIDETRARLTVFASTLNSPREPADAGEIYVIPAPKG